MLEVTKEVTFDCAHMLSGYEGACANLHGHTYKLQVTVVGELIKEGTTHNMVVDFTILKKAIDACVMKHYDHAVIFSTAAYRDDAEEALLCWAEKYNKHFLILSARSTAENMAVQIQNEIRHYLCNEVKLWNVSNVHIKLWETPTSFVTTY